MKRELRDLWDDFVDEMWAVGVAAGAWLGILAVVGLAAR